VRDEAKANGECAAVGGAASAGRDDTHSQPRVPRNFTLRQGDAHLLDASVLQREQLAQQYAEAGDAGVGVSCRRRGEGGTKGHRDSQKYAPASDRQASAKCVAFPPTFTMNQLPPIASATP
jgi:hypothetical protein